MKLKMRHTHSPFPPPARTPDAHPRNDARPAHPRTRGPHLPEPQESALRLVLRTAAGLVFFLLGYMKFFDTIPLGTNAISLPLGPAGFSQYLVAVGVPFPLLSAYLVCLVEMLCGPALLLSAFLPAPAVLTRLCALPLAADMFVATLTVGVRNLLGDPVRLEGIAVTTQAWRFPVEAALLMIAVMLLWKPLPQRSAP